MTALLAILRAALYHRLGIGTCPECDERHRDLRAHFYIDHGDL